MKKTIIILVMLFICFSVFPDIPLDVAAKIYYPSFLEWVMLYLESNIESSNEYYIIVCYYNNINNNIKIIVDCHYDPNYESIDWVLNDYIPAIKETIANKCQSWVGRGYYISIYDFEFNLISMLIE